MARDHSGSAPIAGRLPQRIARLQSTPGRVLLGVRLDEDVQLSPDLIALRRRLPFICVRETLILGNRDARHPAIEAFNAQYQDEPSWLDWALGQADLPTTAAILAV